MRKPRPGSGTAQPLSSSSARSAVASAGNRVDR
jgi:hypothetical protein